jgi:hypothetical protein
MNKSVMNKILDGENVRSVILEGSKQSVELNKAALKFISLIDKHFGYDYIESLYDLDSVSDITGLGDIEFVSKASGDSYEVPSASYFGSDWETIKSLAKKLNLVVSDYVYFD